MRIRKVRLDDKDFVINANDEVNRISGLSSKSCLSKNFEKDLLSKNPKLKCLIVEEKGQQVGYASYSYVYWANRGQGIYLSNVYVVPEYRKHGILKEILSYIKQHEKNATFLTGLVGNDNPLMQNIFKKFGAEDIDMHTYYLKF